ncbi:MAG: hypothetical protein A3C80_02330 [Candidatus Ryanbacteria bacterium RIFCSPHIGHO2_02_FULL_45_43]|uniref:Uncharacterized protein n=1 Tax=Candidatus Ryanbacteria bacterium RIFCSPHIGHO2_01_45_13 TaxID=1802112 RepID=A0A1G2FXJ2_9BACT|nr:MAG: hypothetical protein A2718_00760 [Candidatus Ryanbacteria bacterium RIFCSPHIGHO2_01_FULL_44_130]OGZ42442.1 MAG: hypothetical protein A2W41_03605 [Candidatus Ryanbacteria bacterium RIFCSPHIGHO2_01_45_13]OGZ48459.1 MAG: hypothetical protein A3C80_02330 [Candidatus Ryanbacteria bacterium RIFCSPHIGHO2_02_FULL_45_43]OGZ50324.1 MAG: hypothetical protein A3E55_00230 [Candidatus Ryanbacteria bacterium RIFCSPHIGHO2_12_FULL_44_20]OGZ51663.1 MAG: hypothetical protein A3A17_02680 [Candidatus Ryanba
MITQKRGDTPVGLTYLLLLDILVGVVCGVVAKRKGMNPLFWFISGLLFNLFVLAFLVAMDHPPVKVWDAKGKERK